MSTSILATPLNIQRETDRRVAAQLALNEELYKLMAHVHAQMMLISGDGLENFCSHNDEIKSNYLWSVCDAAERALALLDNSRVA